MRLSTNNKEERRTRGEGRRTILFFRLSSVVSRPSFLVIVFVCCLLSSHVIAAERQPEVRIRKLKNNAYQLLVKNKPYFIKGVCYSPVAIGQGNSEANFWSDPAQPWKIDGKLMKDMGINTVRFYQSPENMEDAKKVINGLYQLYGIRSIMGHWLGFWEYPCPRYADDDFRQKIKEDVLRMVKTYKDEPGILLWILGNENNYSFSERVNPWGSQEIDAIADLKKRCDIRAGIYYSFVNELAQEIHKIDPNHPVALGNGELISLDFANQVCPDIDVVALIVYRGKTFGNLFKSLRATFDKPVIMSEFGADSYDADLKKEDQNMQALFLESQWRELFKNSYPYKEGAQNCLGGTMFEWTDEWWKHNEAASDTWKIHDTESHWSNGSYYFDIKAERNMNMNEEWFGIVALSEELDNGVNTRIPRKAYYTLRDFWRKPIINGKNKKKVKSK
ncbi:MAG TPA: hypothetical protein DCL49_01580 [Candidatus Omnitrophica bacterium]|nr:hypothetical protein [Candidatus Omnitrophota bacterium]HBG64390.1 hypothetical protein [Candidatus Omnitrophota bacterium]